MEEFNIKIKEVAGCIDTAKVSLKLLEQPYCEIRIRLKDERIFKAKEVDWFYGLRTIRKETEPLGIKLLIQGCRPNCWPSGMRSEMSNGKIIYERQIDRNEGNSWRTVNTFDEAKEIEIGLLIDQDKFNDELRKLRKTSTKHS